MAKYVLALDQGTTSSRAILFDRKGNICSVSQEEFRQIYPQPGWVEHDADEIWQTQRRVAEQAMEKCGAVPADVAAIGITNQRETAVVWDKKTGEPVFHAIVWQCRRTAEMIAKLVEDGLSEHVKKTTGLIPDAYFSASKLAWILDNVPGVRERAEAGELLFGNIDTWLIWKLTGGRVHATDRTNASRTMMFDIHRLVWDDTLLDYFRIPRSMLPEVKPSSGIFGTTAPGILGGGIPIAGAAGDQQCALFGQCCFEPGSVKNTYGTGCFLLMNTGTEAVGSSNGLVTTIAASEGERVEYALEGSIFVGGAVVQWLRDELRLIKSAPESEAVALSVPDTNGVYVVPAFTGLGAPYWDPYARGTIVGLTRGAGRAHLVRASLESIAFQVADILKAMEEDAGRKLSGLRVDGGASKNDFLMQFQADILDAKVIRPVCVETTALGAAYLAGLAVGFWKDRADITENWAVDRSFVPGIGEDERSGLLHGWKKAVERAGGWAEA